MNMYKFHRFQLVCWLAAGHGIGGDIPCMPGAEIK